MKEWKQLEDGGREEDQTIIAGPVLVSGPRLAWLQSVKTSNLAPRPSNRWQRVRLSPRLPLIVLGGDWGAVAANPQILTVGCPALAEPRHPSRGVCGLCCIKHNVYCCSHSGFTHCFMVAMAWVDITVGDVETCRYDNHGHSASLVTRLSLLYKWLALVCCCHCWRWAAIVRLTAMVWMMEQWSHVTCNTLACDNRLWVKQLSALSLWSWIMLS